MSKKTYRARVGTLSRVPIVVFLAALTVLWSCRSEPEGRSLGAEGESIAASESRSQHGRRTVQTASGTWRVEELPGPGPGGEKEVDLEPDFDTEVEDVGFDSAYRVAPVVESKADLESLFVGDTTGLDLSDGYAGLKQVVDEIPSRYSGPEYDRVKESLSEACRRSAREYSRSTLGLLGDWEIESALATLGDTTDPTLYDLHCFAPMESVPVEIKRVTGILLYDHVPFCSGTIVSPSFILTSKHCFVNPDTGTKKPSYSALINHNITFMPLTRHSGYRTFSMRPVEDPELEPFPPPDDMIVIEAFDGRFEHHARMSPLAETARCPIPVWVVGANSLVSDIGISRPALGFVRASAPEACSVLEISSSGCLYHSCQTAPMTSGAGLLTMSRGSGVSIVGVHKGPIGRAEGCESEPPLNLGINLAAMVTTSSTTGG